MLRAEKAATQLKHVGETVSDGLLIAMLLKGLPDTYQAFCTVITQRADVTFEQFKSALKDFEENEKARCSKSDDSVLKLSSNKVTCYYCNKPGHKKYECKLFANNKGNSNNNKKSRWCSLCKNATHDTNFCRKKNSTKLVSDVTNSADDNNYMFKVTEHASADNIEIDCCDLLVDCGATAHIICDRSKFIHCDDNFDINKHFSELADGSRKNKIVELKGDAQIYLSDASGTKRCVTLKNALCISSFKQDILSVQSVIQNGSSIHFSPESAELRAPDGNKFNIKKSGKLYYLNSVKGTRAHSLEQWHKIMGHCNIKDLLKLESHVEGMKILDKANFNCSTCIEGKMCQNFNHTVNKSATYPLELVYSDLSGPITPISNEGSKYVISFVDDYSGLIFVYFLKNKSDAPKATDKFLTDIAPYGKLKRLRSDNGTEYTSNEFKALMVKNKIHQEFSAPYSPHQNSGAERAWRTLFDMARCLLLEAGLPKELWNYAVRTSAYIRNRCINSRTGLTPFERFTKKRPDVSNMHMFGCQCFAYVQLKQKLDPRAEKGIFVGYDPLSPAYLVYFHDKQEVRRVRCVKFFEDEFHDDSNIPIRQPSNKPELESTHNSNNDHTTTEIDNNDVKSNESRATIEEGINHPSADTNLNTKHPQRQRKKPKYLDDYVDPDEPDILGCTIDSVYRVVDIPTTYDEAMASPYSYKWQQAMDEEITALQNNDTFELTSRPKDKPIIGGRWVYAVKEGINSGEKYKARYVAKGYNQIEGIDYNETFSPTARITSVRTLINIAVQEDLIVHTMDVKNAYLNAKIDCDIYVEPSGYVKYDNNGNDLVMKLKKSLYGLKQSGKLWNTMLHDYLIELQYVQSLCDNCVYTKHNHDDKVIIIVWVDDLIIAASNNHVLNDIKHALCSKFKMSDLGLISKFLGIGFSVNNNEIEINQIKYINKILQKCKICTMQSRY